MKTLGEYWESLPIGRENSASYTTLMFRWGVSKRMVRNILHRLSGMDNGDDYVLIRSSKSRGFYKTNDRDEIEKYRRETISRAANTFANLKKVNRVLGEDVNQITLTL